MIRKLLKKLGLIPAILALTGVSVVASASLSYIIRALFGIDITTTGIVISISIPAIITPIFGYIFLQVMFQLDATEEKLRLLSIQDELTQVPNRRHFIQLALKQWERARRYGDEFAIVIFDLDQFKSINDTYGHLAGDRVLQAVSEVCMREARAVDTFARFAGDEFVFLIPNSSEVDLGAFMERVRQRIAETRTPFGQAELRFTVSMGAGCFKPGMPSLDAILALADEALYEAKRAGGNRAVIANNHSVTTPTPKRQE